MDLFYFVRWSSLNSCKSRSLYVFPPNVLSVVVCCVLNTSVATVVLRKMIAFMKPPTTINFGVLQAPL